VKEAGILFRKGDSFMYNNPLQGMTGNLLARFHAEYLPFISLT
jgi:hypothetical protein